MQLAIHIILYAALRETNLRKKLARLGQCFADLLFCLCIPWRSPSGHLTSILHTFDFINWQPFPTCLRRQPEGTDHVVEICLFCQDHDQQKCWKTQQSSWEVIINEHKNLWWSLPTKPWVKHPNIVSCPYRGYCKMLTSKSWCRVSNLHERQQQQHQHQHQQQQQQQQHLLLLVVLLLLVTVY